MGNRCFVGFEKERASKVGVYLQWNGGPESVYPMLDTLELAGIRMDTPENIAARFYQVVANFFGGTMSVYLEPACKDLDNHNPGDNGVYYVRYTKTGRVVERINSNHHKYTPEEVEIEARWAYRHEYSKTEPGHPPISQEIAEKNTALFSE